jgi:hypothetical protein
METETYILPDGRAVQIDATISRGDATISFQLADGSSVRAKRAKKPAPTFAGFLASCVADCVESSS